MKDLFRWKAAQHIGVAAARSVVAAHDENVLKMRDLAPAVLLARYGPGGSRASVMEEAREGVAGRGGGSPVAWLPLLAGGARVCGGGFP